MEENTIKVYIKTNENNIITDINSSIFLNSIEGYIQIDEGSGDKYAHAQGNYLEKSLFDESSRFNYKFEDGKILELTEEEKNVLFKKPEVAHSKQEEINSSLLKENANIRLQLAKQEKINSEIMKKLAELGGNQNE